MSITEIQDFDPPLAPGNLPAGWAFKDSGAGTVGAHVGWADATNQLPINGGQNPPTGTQCLLFNNCGNTIAYDTTQTAIADSTASVVYGYSFNQGNTSRCGVFLRGQNLGSLSTASYYLVTIRRPTMVFEIGYVKNGATYAPLGSAQGLTNNLPSPFPAMEIIGNVVGTTIQCAIVRKDTGQWLAPDVSTANSGLWQSTFTWFFSVTDSNITGPGMQGIVKNGGGESPMFDAFRAGDANGDNNPAVSITSPANNASLSANATFTGTPNVAGLVNNMYLVVDGHQFIAGETNTVPAQGILTQPWNGGNGQTPISIVANTKFWTDGTHSVQMAVVNDQGVTALSSAITVTTSNSSIVRPTIPAHLPNIKLHSIAFGNFAVPLSNMDAATTYVATNYTDFINGGLSVAGFHTLDPTKPVVAYTNITNLYESLLLSWLQNADTLGISRELAFYHQSQTLAWSESGSSTHQPPVLWQTAATVNGTTNFLVGTGGSSLWEGQPLSQGTGTALSTVLNDALYVGWPDGWDTLTLTLNSGASGGFTAILQYTDTVDANGNPTHWTALPVITDGTSGFTVSGDIHFNPLPTPSWKPSVGPIANGGSYLFWLRILTTSNGVGTPPNIKFGWTPNIYNQTLIGNVWQPMGTIPIFDYAADVDNDGYLNDTEYANRASGKNARWVHQTRALSQYGGERFAVNPADSHVATWMSGVVNAAMAATPGLAGQFMDNSDTTAGAACAPGTVTNIPNTVENNANYAVQMGQVYNTIWNGMPPWVANGSNQQRFLFNNTAGIDGPDFIGRSPIEFLEAFIRGRDHNWGLFESNAGIISRIECEAVPPVIQAIDTHPGNNSNPYDPVGQLANLCYYYMMASPYTYFSVNGGDLTEDPWCQVHTATVGGDKASAGTVQMGNVLYTVKSNFASILYTTNGGTHNQALSVSLTTIGGVLNSVTVNLATDGTGTSTSTDATIAAAINASGPISAVLSASVVGTSAVRGTQANNGGGFIGACTYNVGTPTGPFIRWQTGADPDNATLQRITYKRTFTNAIVLFTPLSTKTNSSLNGPVGGTPSTYQLGGNYFTVAADGTLSTTSISSIAMSGGMGAILVSTSQPPPPPANGLILHRPFSRNFSHRINWSADRRR